MTKKSIPFIDKEKQIKTLIAKTKETIRAQKFLATIPWVKKELKQEPDIYDYEELIKKIETILK